MKLGCGREALLGDAILSALLAAQVLLNLGHLVFAALCAVALMDRRAVRGALLTGLLADAPLRGPQD